MTITPLPVPLFPGNTRLLVVGRPSPANAQLAAAARPWFRDARVLPGNDLDERVRPEDVVLARLDVRPSLTAIEPGLAELTELEHARPRATILNRAGAIFVCHDKLATSLALGAAGVPHPRTACVDHPSQLRSLVVPLVVKPRLGRHGEEVHICESQRGLERCFRTVAKRPWFQLQGALVQELVPSPRSELRIDVIAGAVADTRVPDAAARLAVRAARAVRADVVEVDAIRGVSGEWMVLDLNIAVEPLRPRVWADRVVSTLVGRRAPVVLAPQDSLRNRVARQPAGMRGR